MNELAARYSLHDSERGLRWLVRSPLDLTILRSLLIIAAPVFALVTWQTEYSHTWTRHFSVPVVICELAIVVLAFATRMDLDAAIRALSPLTKVGTLVWLAVSAWASLYVAEPGRGANYLFLTSALHALFALTMWWKLKTDWRGYGPHMLWAVAIGVALYAVVILMLVVTQVSNPSFNWIHLSLGVSHDRQLAYYGLSLSGIASGMVAFARAPAARAFSFGLLVIGCWLTIWAGGRSGFFGMVFALALIGFVAPQISRFRYAAQTIAALLAAIALSYSFVPHERYGMYSIMSRTLDVVVVQYDSQGRPIESRGALSSFTSGRTDMWADTLERIAEKPLLGHGEGQFRWSVETAFGRFNHPHNSPLQMLFQWGALGTLALLAMLWGTLRAGLTRWRTLPKRAVVALGPLSGLAAMSLLDGAAYYVFPVMVMVMSLTIIAAALDGDASKNSGAKS